MKRAFDFRNRSGILGLIVLTVLAQGAWAVTCVNNGLVPPGSTAQMNAVDGVAGLVIGVGQPTNGNAGVVYVNGVAATLPAGTNQLNAVSVASATYAVAVGEVIGGVPPPLIQYSMVNGTMTWTVIPLTGTAPTQDVMAVKTYGPTQTYAADKNGVYFFDGTTWSLQQAAPAGANFSGLWGNATTIYSLADDGTLYTKAAATPPSVWTVTGACLAAIAGGGAKFNGITGDAAGNVYVTGQTGNNAFIYKFDPLANACTNLYTSATQMQLNGVAVNPTNGAITAVGKQGAVVTMSATGAVLSQILPSGGTQNINAVYIAPNGTTYLAGQNAGACTSFDHIEIDHPGSALTCTPQTVAVKACADAACTILDTTGTVSVTLTPGGQTFAIGATGINSAATVQQSTAGIATLTATSTPVAVNAATCLNTITGAASCAMTFSNSGFLVTVPNQLSCANGTATIEAVQAAPGTGRCVPAYQNVTRAVGLYSTYVSPAIGTRVVTASTGAVSTAAPGTAHNLSFDATGKATITLSYPDAGQLTLTASDIAPLTGAAMTGSGTFVAAPASFAFSAIPAAPLTAGQPFNVTVTAMNACATPAATPNFNGTVTLISSNPMPGIGNAAAINSALSGFVNGVANSNLIWNEVGTITLNASLNVYLGWTPIAPANWLVNSAQAGVGRFHPAYFDTTAVPACGTFSYAGSTTPLKAGQPFTATVTAKAAGGGVTANYAGAYAYLTTLSNSGVTTGFANNTIAAASFTNGAGSANMTYAVATPQTAPLILALRATDADAVSSSGHIEASMPIRSGRLKLSNAHGAETLNLPVPLTAEYWNIGYATNSLDSCTAIVPASVAMVLTGIATTATLNNPFIAGNGGLNLSKPNARGHADITVNAPAWLQYPWGSGAAVNPTARATFGVYKGNDVFIYQRENY